MRFTPEASRILSKYHPENKKLIKRALHDLLEDPYAGGRLQGELEGYRSLKAKRYRILYNINEDKHCIEIIYVGHRRDVYEQFRLLLTNLHRNS